MHVRTASREPEASLSCTFLIRDLCNTPIVSFKAPHSARLALQILENCRGLLCTRACLQALASVSGMPLPLLGKFLLQHRPEILHYGVLDQVGAMTADTLRLRREAADLWAGRTAWRTVSTPGPRGGVHGGERAVLWCASRGNAKQPFPYYQNFTFMLDAATLSTVDKPLTTDERGYSRVDEFYPPEVVAAPDNVGAGVWAMFYIVIHPVLGVVVGPSFTYHGSKTMRGKTKHAPGFECWCGPLPFFLRSLRDAPDRYHAAGSSDVSTWLPGTGAQARQCRVV